MREKHRHSELFWSVFSHIQSECGKIQTRITPNRDTFCAVQLTSVFKKSITPEIWFERKLDLEKEMFSLLHLNSFFLKGVTYYRYMLFFIPPPLPPSKHKKTSLAF